eukprot:3599104-Pyramimonas_sp.AAC.1
MKRREEEEEEEEDEGRCPFTGGTLLEVQISARFTQSAHRGLHAKERVLDALTPRNMNQYV